MSSAAIPLQHPGARWRGFPPAAPPTGRACGRRRAAGRSRGGGPRHGRASRRPRAPAACWRGRCAARRRRRSASASRWTCRAAATAPRTLAWKESGKPFARIELGAAVRQLDDHVGPCFRRRLQHRVDRIGAGHVDRRQGIAARLAGGDEGAVVGTGDDTGGEGGAGPRARRWRSSGRSSRLSWGRPQASPDRRAHATPRRAQGRCPRESERVARGGGAPVASARRRDTASRRSARPGPRHVAPSTRSARARSLMRPRSAGRSPGGDRRGGTRRVRLPRWRATIAVASRSARSGQAQGCPCRRCRAGRRGRARSPGSRTRRRRPGPPPGSPGSCRRRPAHRRRGSEAPRSAGPAPAGSIAAVAGRRLQAAGRGRSPSTAAAPPAAASAARAPSARAAERGAPTGGRDRRTPAGSGWIVTAGRNSGVIRLGGRSGGARILRPIRGDGPYALRAYRGDSG